MCHEFHKKCQCGDMNASHQAPRQAAGSMQGFLTWGPTCFIDKHSITGHVLFCIAKTKIELHDEHPGRLEAAHSTSFFACRKCCQNGQCDTIMTFYDVKVTYYY